MKGGVVKLSMSNDFCFLEGRFHGNVRFLAILGFSRERGEKGKVGGFFIFLFFLWGWGVVVLGYVFLEAEGR